jgi:GT2 family glycosyltransferase
MTPVSVAMPVRNSLPYLAHAIASVLHQDHQALELVIVDDGSTDGSYEFAHDLAQTDERVRVFRREGVPGLVASANEAVRRCRHDLIARADADDTSDPTRVRREVDVLERRPDAVLVGTLADGIDTAGRRVRSVDRSRLTRTGFFSPFPHGSAMFRRHQFEAAGGYREECAGWEELELWLRLSRFGRVVVIPDPLYHYRYLTTTTSASVGLESAARVVAARRRFEERMLDGQAAHGEPCAEWEPTATEVAAALAEAYASKAALFIWSGTPAPAPSRPVRERLRRWSRPWLYATVGSRCPCLLRWALRVHVRCRDTLARGRLGEEVEWRFVPS